MEAMEAKRAISNQRASGGPPLSSLRSASRGWLEAECVACGRSAITAVRAGLAPRGSGDGRSAPPACRRV